MQNDKNLVTMYIEGTNYDFNGIKVTVKSLREHYKGDIVVLYNGVDASLIHFLNEYDVLCIDCSDYKVLVKTAPYNNKIIYTFMYFDKYQEDYKDYNILCCDISDLYFTENPFNLQQPDIYLSLEDNKIGSCPTNNTWIIICYGSAIAHQMKDEVIINGGIVLGTFNQFFRLYKLVLDDMAKILTVTNYPVTDQAIINKLVYVNHEKCYLDSVNVNNLAQQVRNDIDNKINHQYKCFPELKSLLYDRYQ